MENNASYPCVIVYPAAEMRFVCPYCRANCTIIKDSTPEENFTAPCTACGQPICVRINMRKFYRKSVNIEASYLIKGVNRPPRKGTILDISTGGLRFKCYKSIHEKIGNLLSLSFVLPPRNEIIKVNGEITRIMEETNTTVTLGLRFKGLGEYEEMQVGFFLQP
ncbi:MAG: PilZ domain-containing protein [Nitrospirae bacterium]|nr:PilZ domain-containing protein [Nitrospirota bacterium]